MGSDEPALILASIGGQEEIVKVLLAKKAVAIAAKDDGFTPLSLAAQKETKKSWSNFIQMKLPIERQTAK